VIGAVDVPSMSERPAPRHDVETAFLAPEAVLLETPTGRVHHLNAGASAVWMLLDGELTIAEIADELADLFDRATTEMVPDVEAAVTDFAARGLLAGTAPAGRRSRASVLPRPPDP
jgi:hypothetical protein